MSAPVGVAPLIVTVTARVTADGVPSSAAPVAPVPPVVGGQVDAVAAAPITVTAAVRAAAAGTAPATGPPTTGGPGLVAAAPIRVVVAARAAATAAPPTDTGGGVAVTVAAPPGVLSVTAPAAFTAAAVAVASVPDAVVVPGPRPAFVVTVTGAAPGDRVQVQWSPDPSLPAGGSASADADAPAGLDDAPVTVAAGQDVPDGLVYWRARVVGAYGPGRWSPVAQFGVDSGEGSALAAGSVRIGPQAVPVPHVWFVDTGRTGTAPGDTGVLAGTGFGAAPRVWLGDLPCTVGNVADIPGSAAGDTRTLTGMWHQEITFTIPDVGPDHTGDALTVARGD